MANYGFDDILVAYPIVGEEKVERLKKLHQHINITTIVDSLEVASTLAQVGSPDHPLPVLIDIDSGIHRGGRQPGKDTMDFAHLWPSGMTFVRSKDGISYSPAEWSSPEDYYDGANVFYETVLKLARSRVI
ncbi:MAG: alanine racemase [Desulfitobacteriaceae bacterium]